MKERGDGETDLGRERHGAERLREEAILGFHRIQLFGFGNKW